MPKLAKLGIQGDLRPVSLIVNLQSPEIEMPATHYQLPINRGAMTVNVVHPDGGWSTTMINQTSGNRRIDASGRLRSSSLTLVNAASNETWTGSCNQRRIGGQINGGSGLTFVIW